eukprot:TRINITY_DN86443_c0_g1_i1.p1 TRINITY_DN86443_c0_g1~~TRINITY_DN86443_c0_g1_i1.p1  ORF type:complete len:258 (+),score=14.33 TRINITY_DN86443_c0_g1_i1:67-840(+)
MQFLFNVFTSKNKKTQHKNFENPAPITDDTPYPLSVTQRLWLMDSGQRIPLAERLSADGGALLCSSDMAVTHMNGTYWKWEKDAHSPSPKHEYACLLSVCWLHAHGTISLQGGQRYAVFVALRLTDGVNFEADWHIMYKTEKLLSYKHDIRKGALTNLEESHGWALFSLGELDMPNPGGEVSPNVFGGNPYWASGLHMDYWVFQPIPLYTPWEIAKLLLLPYYCNTSSLSTLCLDVIKIVGSFLAAPPTTFPTTDGP